MPSQEAGLPRLDWVSGNDAAIDQVAAHLESGGLLAYPTETVYGLGARVSPAEVKRVQALKGRDVSKPFLLLIPTPSVPDLAWTDQARALAQAFWPGPLTLVLDDPAEAYPAGVRGPGGGVAIRLSSSPFVSALHRVWPQALLSTSANRKGAPPARDAQAVEEAFGQEGGGGEESGLWLVDGGELPASPPSTIVDCTEPLVRILREGAIPSRAVEKCLNLSVHD
jgi:L-threonylcarbamoyladenylate synthase